MKASKAIGYAATCASVAFWVSQSSVCLPLSLALRTAQAVMWIKEQA